MKVEFDGDEMLAIVKKHVMADRGLSEAEVVGARWETYKDERGNWKLRVTVGVKLRDPYR